MFIYYQTVENSKQTWILGQPERLQDIDTIKQEAFHIGLYITDKDPGRNEENTDSLLYQGDLWFDIDHKPQSDNPSLAEREAAIQESIMDVRRLISYVEAKGLEAKYLRLFATGGKGFHVCIPAKGFDGAGKRKRLPKIHKFMVQVICEEAGITGADMQMYAGGKGHLIRVENKLRSNGKYKVGITPDDVKVMTPAMYAHLTSEPRTVAEALPVPYARGLAFIWDEACMNVDDTAQAVFISASSAALDVFDDEYTAPCVEKIVNHEDIVDTNGKFNRAKMSLARYLVHAPITEAKKTELLDTFAGNWHSDRHRTESDRRKAVTSIFKIVRDQGFSCNVMTVGLAKSPCRDCKLNHNVLAEQADQAQIDVTPFNYRQIVARGVGQEMTNFLLDPIAVYFDLDDRTRYAAIDFQVRQRQPDTSDIKVLDNLLSLSGDSWNSPSKLKAELTGKTGLIWIGTDNDLQKLKAYLDGVMQKGLEQRTVNSVNLIKTLGVNHYVDPDKGIDEYVWVEDDYSVNASRVVNTLKHKAISSEDGNIRVTWPLQKVQPYHGSMVEESKTIAKLFDINNPAVMGTCLGWFMSCWLRTHLRDHTNDRHLPGLQLFGGSGNGKTETATLLSMLAGADYRNSTPAVVSGTTPFALKVEGAMTTTVPRILDEMNEFKIPERSKYNTAREVVKAAANAGSMKQGMISEGSSKKGTVVDDRPMTSPLVILATQMNAEKEIMERTVGVSISRSTRTKENSDNLLYVKNNLEHVLTLTKLAMESTLDLDVVWLVQAVDKCYKDLPAILQRADRVSRNWTITLLGLEFLQSILEKAEAPAEVMDVLVSLRTKWADWLIGHAATLQSDAKVQEIDVIIDTFGSMIAVDRSSGYSRKFKHGEHYVIQGDTLYIWTSVFFPQYIRYCRQTMNKPPELNSLKQFNDLIAYQPYFIKGAGAPAGAKGGSGWNAFILSKLPENGIQIDNFIDD